MNAPLRRIAHMLIPAAAALILAEMYLPTTGYPLMSTERWQKLERKSELMQAVAAGGGTDMPHLEYYIIPRTLNSERRISEGLRNGMEQLTAQRDILSLRKQNIANTWTPVGPTRIGGRVRVVKYHPFNPDIVYAGSASGGLFKSTDGGDSWNPLTDFLPTLAIGHMAIDRNNPDHLYIGTGEGSYNWDKVYGDGIYKSTDGGATWVNIMQDVIRDYDLAINHIELHPANSQIIYAAATFGGGNGGLLRTDDGGENWMTVLNGPARDVVLDPTNPDRVFTAFGDYRGSSSNGIYLSEQKGDRWTFNKLTANLPQPDSIGRIVMDISPSRPGTLVAVMQRSSRMLAADNEDFLGVFRSTDHGTTWERLPSSDQENMKTVLRGQGDYNLFVRFHPTDHNVIFMGGIYTWRSTDFGESFSQMTAQTGVNGAWVDMHYADFSPTHPNQMIVSGDGGMFLTGNALQTSPLFEEINDGLVTMQFYAMDFDRQEPTRVAGGTQDRRNNLGDVTTGEWKRLGWSGDGGYVAFDHKDQDVFYITSQYGNLAKTTNGGATFRSARNGLERTASNGGYLFSFVTPFIMHPTDSRILFVGGNRMYRTTNSAASWQPISEDLTQSTSSLSQFQDLSFCKADPNILYGVTGFSRRAYRSTNALADTDDVRWERIDNGLPNLFLSEVEVHPTDGDIAYVGTAGFSPASGVYKTTDGGQTWQLMRGETERSKLPEIPVGAVAIWEKHPDIIFAGTDLGVFVSKDAGRNWYPFGEGLPNVVIDDLKITPDDILFAATHGRGMWMTSATLTVQEEAERTRPFIFTLDQNFPNPFNPSTVIPFRLERAGMATMRMYDAQGRFLRTLLDEYRDAGAHTVHVDATGLQSGVYLYELSSGNQREVRKMSLVK
ncbi:MAG: T9SS type A sorting domain-containing protein [Bacteroidetes bacterium]|nr:T9SS type A sorting domain-containing protein [Bacteroidota bacterium]